MKRRRLVRFGVLLLFGCGNGEIHGRLAGGVEPPPMMMPVPVDHSPCAFSVDRPPPGASWQPTGPGGGNVTALLSLPGGVVVVGTGASNPRAGRPGRASAIYRSIDHGQSFRVVMRFSSGLATVVSLVAIPGSMNVLAAVTQPSDGLSGAIYRSSDQGAHFTAAGDGLHPGARPRMLSAAAMGAERVFALIDGTPADPNAIETSLYVEDGAAAWTRVTATGLDPAGGGAAAIAVDPADRDRLYAADGQNFYAGTMAGASFSGAPYLPPTAAIGLRTVLGIHPDPGAPGRILLATDRELLSSADRGMSWQVDPSVPGGGATGLAFSAGRTFLVASGLKTSSGGAFAALGSCLLAPALKQVAVAPDQADELFVSAAGPGLYRSTDGGQSFSPAAIGIDELLGRVMVTGSTAWILSEAGLYRLADDRRSWSRVGGALSTGSFSDLALDPSDPDALLLSTNEDLFAAAGPAEGVLRYSLSTGQATPAEGLAGPNIGRVVVDPKQPSRVYAYQLRGALDDPSAVAIGVARSDDGGRHFQASALKSLDTAPFYPFTFPSSPLAISPDGTVYAGILVKSATESIAHQVWRSTDGQRFAPVWSDDGAANAVANGVYAGPAGAVFVAGRYAPSPLWMSPDGSAFAPFGSGVVGGLPTAIDLAIGSDGTVATVSGSTVALAKAGGMSFSALNDGLDPNAIAVSVAVLPGDPELVLIGTLAGGIQWRVVP